MIILGIGCKVLIGNKNFGVPHEVLAIDDVLLLAVLSLLAGYFFFQTFRCNLVHINVILVTIILQRRWNSSLQIIVIIYYHVAVCWSSWGW